MTYVLGSDIYQHQIRDRPLWQATEKVAREVSKFLLLKRSVLLRYAFHKYNDILVQKAELRFTVRPHLSKRILRKHSRVLSRRIY